MSDVIERLRKWANVVPSAAEAAILLTLVGLLWPAFSAARAAASRSPEEAATREPPQTYRLWTGQHDGHWWVISPDHFQHHPDCPCVGRKAESEAK